MERRSENGPVSRRSLLTMAHFEGCIVTVWEEDGVTMSLVEPFAFVDDRGKVWMCEIGTRIDGASAPACGLVSVP